MVGNLPRSVEIWYDQWASNGPLGAPISPSPPSALFPMVSPLSPIPSRTPPRQSPRGPFARIRFSPTRLLACFAAWLPACSVVALVIWMPGGRVVGSEPVAVPGTSPASVGDVSDGERRAAIDLFERHIRPTLIEHCFDCHSQETEKSGGLALDSPRAWAEGGDLGPAVVPGDPDASLLMRVIRYDEPDLQMPPDGKLDAQTIDAFRRWIEAGAIDPRQAADHDEEEPASGLSVERATEHWSYRPLAARRPDVAAASVIDGLIEERLRDEGLSAVGRADRRVLIRRLSFDLTGLPPSPAEIDAFVADASPDAYGRLVDRLLASNHFGEHFARRWLDVARFAESVTLRGLVMPEAWRYRDYLIHAFNGDRPFDRMIRDQIAGDLVPDDDIRERQWSAVATGFLALGNSNLEDQDKTKLDFDHIDEQLETIGRAFLGQTIGCARCHDHKFDPIPTSDYYALAGIMRSTEAMEHSNVSRWIERPLPLSEAESRRYEALSERLGEVERELKELEPVSGGERPRQVDPARLDGVVVDDSGARFVGNWTESASVPGFVGSGYRHDDNRGRGEKTATFEPKSLSGGRYRVRISYTPGGNRASNVPVQVFSANESVTIRVNQRKPPPEDGIWLSLGEFPFEADGQAFVMVSNEGTDGHVIVDAVQFLPLSAADPPAGRSAETEASGGSDEQDAAAAEAARSAQRKAELTAEQKRLRAELAARPKFLTVDEAEPVAELPIRIRGGVHSLGPAVPRGFLTAIPPATEIAGRIPDDRSGRLELADWIADGRNPLTARVYANRVWSWLMGQGLVATENNFGTTGEEPSHPELLDRLAADLIRDGWSTKRLVRRIVTSEAYRRGMADGEHPGHGIDPYNRLLWSAPLRRIPVEAMRDAMLTVSGELDRAMEGSSIRPGTNADYGYRDEAVRRSVYAPVFRNSLPALYRVFDFADASVSVGRRSRSTVATQSLTLMNDPWIIARARAAAARWAQAPVAGDPETLVDHLYRASLGREPTDSERRIAMRFLADSPEEERLQTLIHTLFASLDFRFLD